MKPVIEMKNITKRFPGIVANDNVTLSLEKGEIHALLGENGAGKSTLMSILFGLYEPDEGTIEVNGQPVNIKDPNDANRYGIGMVHQHFKLVDNFTVLENILLGIEPTEKGIFKPNLARKRVEELSKQYNFNIDPDAKIEDISVGMQQRVEIIKMLYRNNDILIFDEPTAVLTPQEIDELMKIMHQLVSEGKSIIFITHKLNEIKHVADRVTILRKGKYISTVDVENTTVEMMSELMVGRKVNLSLELEPKETGKTVLKVRNLSYNPLNPAAKSLANLNFDLKEGEILGIAGIEGNGQTELIYALTGLIDHTEGTIELNGEDVSKASIRHRNTHGLAHIPEDRQKHGLVLDFSLSENFALQTYFEDAYQKNGMIDFDKREQHAKQLIEQFDVRSGEGAKTKVRSMSGGNQQKAIVAREMERDHNVLIAVQPTRGLDVGAIEYIHRQIVNERDAGKAILMVSLEMNEVLGLSDRILVMYKGEFVGALNPKEITEQDLGLYMAGVKKEAVDYEK
ncbi:heme ABC transporter ATP-binding protein [Erysipelothrix larvae]|uniref:Heme ABC transporter ATP-binding protein n=1 Tax=Erysipelothrix larvae TaxID=1514105 RepID=A0A0X8GYW2_9FIRM|nr:ABC transporter ATP-binding protein [Erysipelothrix larvae]AMC92930.1 heme ABC transporter ATP-binding protein [Erysipelothrix larvae]